MALKILMLGWEFPPFISGGLGTACYGLTRALARQDIEVIFVLPRGVDEGFTSHVRLLGPHLLEEPAAFTEKEMRRVRFRTIASPLRPYTSEESYRQSLEDILRKRSRIRDGKGPSDGLCDNYGPDMAGEVCRYASMAVQLAGREDFDVVHAHDWMTYPAGAAVAAAYGRPLVVHIHSTEFDRSGEHVNQMIYRMEKEGMQRADRVIAVSNLTRKIVVERYGIDPEKVVVVHNGIQRTRRQDWLMAEDSRSGREEKLVLFLGRITMQKGPEYFLQAAKRVLDVVKNVRFVMVGSGDMMKRAVEMAASLGIGSKVSFTGFLRGAEVERIYRMADLFVMPSVSEPFGLVCLEALENDVPVIISRQSGVSEVLTHALKVDFWDVEEMANKIAAVLRYPALETTLRHHGNFEVRRLRWADSAGKCVKVYEETLSAVG
jgi:glycosyltransferase involved in cell wall biosynthesis